ncbi:alpha-ribazole phosphatase [Aliagarivorans taiwanensis]|uniref:alpha-ribazole phosphatase n=1 Tax=Aliagarivorans taiwanensis TaxID=561966 RepID=UPI000478CC0C|nr:alpha-ribazole phosphatase [Aliagarivorans taiwanensis]
MEVYLVRHTTPKVEKGVCYGQSDLDVADSFTDEVQAIVSNTPELRQIDAIYASPLRRCKRLAQQLTTDFIAFDERLKELNFGDWELRRWNDIPEYEYRDWGNDYVNVRCPGGESFVDLYQRVSAFKTDLLASGLKRAVIVTHCGVIRAFLSIAHNTELKDAFSYQFEYGQVVRVSL